MRIAYAVCFCQNSSICSFLYNIKKEQKYISTMFCVVIYVCCHAGLSVVFIFSYIQLVQKIYIRSKTCNHGLAALWYCASMYGRW